MDSINEEKASTAPSAEIETHSTLDASQWKASGNGIHKGVHCVAITQGDDRAAVARAIVHRCQSYDSMVAALTAIADCYHADQCPVYHPGEVKDKCDCHVGIARAALAAVSTQGNQDTDARKV